MRRAIISAVGAIVFLLGCDEAEELAGEDETEVAEAAPVDEVSGRGGECATMYEHWHFEGEAKRVEAGAYVSFIGNLWNDVVSSVQVRSGCVLNVFEHADFAGAQNSFQGSVPFVGEWWNDKISAYTCDC